MRETLVFSEIVPYGKSLISIFQQFSASIKNNFGLGGRLGTTLKFYEVLRFS